jgi:uncharacterized protein
MNKLIKTILLVLTVTCLVFSAFAGASRIKARMKTRLPQIEALKKQLAIGENNLGYLAVLKKAVKADVLVAAENKDRKIIYIALAKKYKTTERLVGMRRAKKIFELAPKGQMIQDANGKWIKK